MSTRPSTQRFALRHLAWLLALVAALSATTPGHAHFGQFFRRFVIFMAESRVATGSAGRGVLLEGEGALELAWGARAGRGERVWSMEESLLRELERRQFVDTVGRVEEGGDVYQRGKVANAEETYKTVRERFLRGDLDHVTLPRSKLEADGAWASLEGTKPGFVRRTEVVLADGAASEAEVRRAVRELDPKGVLVVSRLAQFEAATSEARGILTMLSSRPASLLRAPRLMAQQVSNVTLLHDMPRSQEQVRNIWGRNVKGAENFVPGANSFRSKLDALTGKLPKSLAQHDLSLTEDVAGRVRSRIAEVRADEIVIVVGHNDRGLMRFHDQSAIPLGDLLSNERVWALSCDTLPYAKGAAPGAVLTTTPIRLQRALDVAEVAARAVEDAKAAGSSHAPAADLLRAIQKQFSNTAGALVVPIAAGSSLVLMDRRAA